MEITYLPGSILSGFFRALKVDLHRAVLSRSFLLSVVMILAYLTVNAATTIFIYDFLFSSGIPNAFNNAVTGTSGLGMAVLPMATVPYSVSYLTDRRSGFEHFGIARVGCFAYTCARVVSVGISGFLSMVTAAAILLAALCCSGAPLDIAPGDGMFYNGTYLDLVYQVSPLFFFFVRFTIWGMTGILASVFALFVTTWVPNTYVALLSPLIVYYGSSAVFALLSYLTNGKLLFLSYLCAAGVIEHQVSRNNIFSFVWATVYLLTLSVLCGHGFVCRVRKEQDYEHSASHTA